MLILLAHHSMAAVEHGHIHPSDLPTSPKVRLKVSTLQSLSKDEQAALEKQWPPTPHSSPIHVILQSGSSGSRSIHIPVSALLSNKTEVFDIASDLYVEGILSVSLSTESTHLQTDFSKPGQNKLASSYVPGLHFEIKIPHTIPITSIGNTHPEAEPFEMHIALNLEAAEDSRGDKRFSLSLMSFDKKGDHHVKIRHPISRKYHYH